MAPGAGLLAVGLAGFAVGPCQPAVGLGPLAVTGGPPPTLETPGDELTILRRPRVRCSRAAVELERLLIGDVGLEVPPCGDVVTPLGGLVAPVGRSVAGVPDARWRHRRVGGVESFGGRHRCLPERGSTRVLLGDFRRRDTLSVESAFGRLADGTAKG